MRWTRPRAVIGMLLALGTWSGCAEPVAGVDPVIVDEGLEAPVAWPDDPAMAAALPGPAQVGGIGGFSSCRNGQEVCAEVAAGALGGSSVRASDQGGPDGAHRWVDVTVSRHATSSAAQEDVAEAVRACPPGEFGGSGSPQGFHPRAPSYVGVRQRFAAEYDGFRGTRCADGFRSPGGPATYDHHVLVVARTRVVLRVAAWREDLALRLLEEYVDRLARTASPR